MNYGEFVLLALAVVLLVSGMFALFVLREKDRDDFAKERAAWVVERKDLNDRLLARSPSEYLALKRQEFKPAEVEAPVAKTTNYDGAWSS